MAPALGMLAVAVATGGCGGSGVTALGGDPGRYLITLGQLPSPDFTLYRAEEQVSAGWLDEGSSAAVREDGLTRAEEVEYYRDVPFSTSDGPITVAAAAAAFTTGVGATAAMIHLDGALDARPVAVPVSAGTLGDGGSAVTVQGSVDGVSAVQIIVVWRVDNLVNSLVAEGRLGGLQLDQILPIATTQTANERPA
jgi:hypothetical protein